MSDHLCVARAGNEEEAGLPGDGEARPVPVGGLLSAWGALMATRSDALEVQRQIRRQRWIVAGLMTVVVLASIVAMLVSSAH